MLTKIKLQFLVLILIGFACDDGEETQKEGQVKFSVSGSINPGGRSKTDAHSILISVKNSEGNLIYESKVLPLYKFGDEYLSEAISLTAGNFTLTEFIVVDEDNAAVLATPLEGAPLAYLVNDPLPISFTVDKDQTTQVEPQVITVEGNSSSDFGYTTFSLDVVETISFSAGVLAYSESSHNFELTSANVEISSGSESLYNMDLPASTNEIIVRDNFENYTISVTKPGFIIWEKTLTAAELKAYVDATPLVITLLGESLEEGLVAYYPFSGDAEDESGNSLHGTVNGATLTTDRDGNANAAYQFDGINDYISVAHHNSLNLEGGDFTISLWASANEAQPDGGTINDILRKWTGDTQGYPFAISYSNDASPAGTQRSFLAARYDGSGCSHAPFDNTSQISLNEFHHLVVIKEGSTINMYLDGDLVTTFTDNTTCGNSNTANMTIGCRGNIVRFFSGKIDDIRIYSRALEQSEIAGLFNE